MAPILNGSEIDALLVDKKFVRIGEKIAYDDGRKAHCEIAWDNFPETLETLPNKPLVDDKGEIKIEDDFILFEGRQQGTVLVKVAGTESREETKKIARILFGRERIR